MARRRGAFDEGSDVPLDIIRAMSSAAEAMQELAAAGKEREKREDAPDRKRGGLPDKVAKYAGGLSVGLLAEAVRQGIVTANTTSAGFGVGASNFLNQAVSNFSGLGLRDSNAIKASGDFATEQLIGAAFAGADLSDLNQAAGRIRKEVLPRFNNVQQFLASQEGTTAKALNDYYGTQQLKILEAMKLEVEQIGNWIRNR